MLLTKDLNKIKSKFKLYLKGKPVKKAYLFGSFVRNEMKTNSDIDILLELDTNETVGMIEFIKLSDGLGLILNNKVDVVTSDGLSPHIRPFIEKEKVLIYEA